MTADLTKSEDLSRLLNKTIEKYGKLDILVNNVGVYPSSPIRDKNFMQLFDQILAINLRSVVELIHMAIPYLEKTNGSIINVSGIGAQRPVS